MDSITSSFDTTNSGIAAPESADMQSRVKQTAADKMQTAAAFLRDQTDTPVVGRFAEPAARSMEQAARYVQGSSLEDVRSDVAGMIRQYPLRSLAIGLGIGLFIGRLGKR